ncbi:MAG: cation transporter [Clostridiales bacterium]|nr:cation transporter [Clostridiales bacterium]MCD7826996.1 cation transporter [Clostridiales bacterium]
MVRITVKVDGMQCGMCEAHINDAIRNAFKVKKVNSSHTKGETVIIAKEDIDENEVRDVINKTGYTAAAIEKEPYEKKGLFG